MPFAIPNEADAAFAAQAAPDARDIDILVAGYAGTGVIDGCAVTAQATPDMTLAVAAGTVAVLGTTAAVTAGNVTITTAHATNPRFDLVVVSSAGTKSVTAGTAAAAPVFPAIPASSVVLAAVYVPANDTAIGSTQIVDKRVTAASYPRSHHLVTWMAEVVVAGSWQAESRTGLGGGNLNNPGAALNDEVGFDLLLEAGAWDLTVIGTQSNGAGISHLRLDGVEFGTYDWYASSTVVNHRTVPALAFSVATTGVKRLTFKMASKNASSSSYSLRLQGLMLRKTA